MSRVRVKTVKKTLANPDVQRLFSSAIGGGDAAVDVKVAWPKFKRIRRHVERTIALLRWLGQSEWLRQCFPAEAEIICKYVATLANEYQTDFVRGMPDLDAPGLRTEVGRAVYGGEKDHEARDAFVLGLEGAPPEDIAAFTARYNDAVKSDLVNTAVKTCSNLTPHKASLENYEQLKGHFLLGAGLSFAPIPGLPAANFKAFYQRAMALSPSRAKAGEVLVFLHKLYSITHEVYEAANSPDVDVEEFVTIISDSIQQVQNQPGLERCGAAFKKLLESVSLLRKNFGTYYRDSVQSGNSSLLMENFVMDVAGNSTDSPPHVRVQFKKIIAHYRKMAASQPKDEQTQALFGEIESNFAELERREGAVAAEDVADEEGAAAAGAAGAPAVDESAAATPDEAAAPPTAAAQRALDEGREMSEAERQSHKAELKKRCRHRADVRRKATKSMDAFLAAHATRDGLSELAREVLASEPGGSDVGEKVAATGGAGMEAATGDSGEGAGAAAGAAGSV